MAGSVKSRFKNAILCEEVRKENNNKLILLGVFSGSILVSAFPAEVRLAVYFEFVPERAGEHKIDFRLMIGEKKALEMKGSLEVGDASEVAGMALPSMVVSFAERSTFGVEVSLDGSKWHRILTKEIRQGDVPT